MRRRSGWCRGKDEQDDTAVSRMDMRDGVLPTRRRVMSLSFNSTVTGGR